MLRQQLSESLKRAMKNRDQAAISTLRLVTSSLKEKDRVQTLEQGKPELSDAEIMQMLQTMIKQRHESIAAYRDGGRQDLADKETAEIDLLQSFLPQALTEENLIQAIDAALVQVRQQYPDLPLAKGGMGKVIRVLKSAYPGQIDMGKAAGLVKTRIAESGDS